MTRPLNTYQTVISLLRERYSDGRITRDVFKKADQIAIEAQQQVGEELPDTATGWDTISAWLNDKTGVTHA